MNLNTHGQPDTNFPKPLVQSHRMEKQHVHNTFCFASSPAECQRDVRTLLRSHWLNILIAEQFHVSHENETSFSTS